MRRCATLFRREGIVHLLAPLFLTLLYWQVSQADLPLEVFALPQPQQEEFQVGGRTFVMDPYSRLFGNDYMGSVRSRLFEGYLKSSTEGQQRVRRAKNSNPATVWATLGYDERAVFLTITKAMASLRDATGDPILAWLMSLECIHGKKDPATGQDYPNNSAFRLYVQLSEAGLRHVRSGHGLFNSLCTKQTFGYDSAGSTHPRRCPIQPGRFDSERKTERIPNLQFNFNFTDSKVDIDIDFYPALDLLRHPTNYNSDVLARRHTERFIREFCDSGFRVKP